MVSPNDDNINHDDDYNDTDGVQQHQQYHSRRRYMTNVVRAYTTSRYLNVGAILLIFLLHHRREQVVVARQYQQQQQQQKQGRTFPHSYNLRNRGGSSSSSSSQNLIEEHLLLPRKAWGVTATSTNTTVTVVASSTTTVPLSSNTNRINGNKDNDHYSIHNTTTTISTLPSNSSSSSSSVLSIPVPSKSSSTNRTSATTINAVCTNSTIPTTRRKQRVPSWKASLPEPLCYKNEYTLQKICIRLQPKPQQQRYNNNIVDIYIIGTAHVSNDSSYEVQLLLSHIQPDCIFLELCDSRIALLGYNNNTNVQEQQQQVNHSTVPSSSNRPLNSTWQDRFINWKRQSTTADTTITSISGHNNNNNNNNNWFQTMSAGLLSSVQEDYAKQLGVELGGEFRCAYHYWYNQQQQQQQQAEHRQRLQQQQSIEQLQRTLQQQHMARSLPPYLVLGDRPVQLTLIRAWESLTFIGKIKLCCGLLWASLPFNKASTEELRNWMVSIMNNKNGTDILTQSLEELRQSFPTLYTTIISERDAWLAAKLMQVSTSLHLLQQQQLLQYDTNNATQYHRRQTIVAVVGAGHVPGIVKSLTMTPSPSTTTPEQVLADLVTTKRWTNDRLIQDTMIPSWIYDVVEIPFNDMIP